MPRPASSRRWWAPARPASARRGFHGSETRCNSCEVGIWADPDGTVFWGDCSGRLRRYDGETGIVTTVFGGTSVHDGGPATQAFLCCPGGIDIGPDGHIYFGDVFNQRVRAIDPTDGTIRDRGRVGREGLRRRQRPRHGSVHGGSRKDVSLDSRGRVVLPDHRHGRVRRVDEDGIIRTVAGAEDKWDRGDNGPAVLACLVGAMSVAHTPNDDIYIGDEIGRIRKIDAASGIITTVVGTGMAGYSGDGRSATKARIGTPTAIRFDRAGNLYFSDSVNHVVRRVDTAGVITTLAGTGEPGFSPDGTPACEARLHRPSGMTVGPDGVVYVSDTRNGRIRVIDADGNLQTVAGSETPGDAGDGGPATEASLNEPHGIRLFGDDILLISDHFNNRIKAVKLP